LLPANIDATNQKFAGVEDSIGISMKKGMFQKPDCKHLPREENIYMTVGSKVSPSPPHSSKILQVRMIDAHNTTFGAQ
jgi:hypothetical protein